MTSSRGRARLGLLVPFTNTNLEPDMAMMAPTGVSLHVARMGGYDAEAVPDAAQMQGLGASDISEPLRLLAGARPDVVLYGCTSATLTHGPAFDRTLAARVAEAAGVPTITAARALVTALGALGTARVGFAAPYVTAINDMAVAYLAGCGIETVGRHDVDAVLDNEGQGALAPEAVLELGRGADAAGAEAVVLSCTDMRAAEIAGALEAELGKPVVTSNTALIWAALAAAGIGDPVSGFGRLLERARP